MLSNIRNNWMLTTAKAGGAVVLVTACIGAGTAAADDSWKLTVNNSGSVPLKVVILDSNGVDITADRSAEFIKGSGTVTVKKKGPYRWEVFAPGEKEPCQKQRDVSGTSISVHCEPKAAAVPAPKPTPPSPPPSGDTKPQPAGSGSPKLPPLQTDSTGCSMKDFTSRCPPKSMSADIRKRAGDTKAVLDKIGTEIDALGPNDAEKLKGLIERYNTAKAADDVYRKDLDTDPGPPAEHIDYKTDLKKKEDDLATKLKKKGEELCTPKPTKTSAGCEFVTNWLSGHK